MNKLKLAEKSPKPESCPKGLWDEFQEAEKAVQEAQKAAFAATTVRDYVAKKVREACVLGQNDSVASDGTIIRG